MVASKKVDILHIFQECSRCMTDPYWIQLFEDCSRKKFPKGFGYSQQVVYFKGKEVVYVSLEGKNTEKLAQELKLNFQQLGFKSDLDQTQSRQELDNFSKLIEQHTHVENWKEIRKKNIKDMLIRNYVLGIKKEYHLDQMQTEKFYKLLKLAFLFNWITSNNVHYQNNHIHQIDNILYNKQTGQIELIQDSEYTDKREYTTSKIIPSVLYKRFVQAL